MYKKASLGLKTVAITYGQPNTDIKLCSFLGNKLYTGCTTIKWQMYFVNFGPFKCNKMHFFDNFVHKTFAQFILHTF